MSSGMLSEALERIQQSAPEKSSFYIQEIKIKKLWTRNELGLIEQCIVNNDHDDIFPI